MATCATAEPGLARTQGLAPHAAAVTAAPGRVIDTFQADSAFTRQSTAGSLEPDLDDVLLGSRAMRVTTDGDGLQVNLRAGLHRPIDLSRAFLLLNLKVRDLKRLDYLVVYLSTDGFETFDAFPLLRGTQGPVGRFAEEDRWFTLTAALGTTVAGLAPSIDLTAVTDVQLSVRDDGSGPVTAWFDSLAAVPSPERGKVSLVFDDARDGVFDFALPLTQRLGLAASIAVIVDLVGQPTFMTLEQLKAVERFAGWEVIAHQASLLERGGFDTLSEAELRAELAGVKSWLLDNGFRRGADVIAYPYGGYDEESVAHVGQYFGAGRTIVRAQGLETWPPADPYRIRAVSVASTDTPADINALIDRAARDRAWLILVFHQIHPRGSDHDTYYYTEDLASILAHLAGADVEVVRLSDALFQR